MRVLLVGWDGADWKIIRRLVAEGKMPNLAKLISEGAAGNLATLFPSFSPMVWTSIATGKRPFRHRVLGFTEPDTFVDLSVGVRPVTSLSRQCRAVWNIMTLASRKSVVVNWWPSYPAEPIDGVMVSNTFFQENTIPENTVHPVEVTKLVSGLKLSAGVLNRKLLQKFLPWLLEADAAPQVGDVAKILANTLSVHRVAMLILNHESWDFAAVYYPGIDRFSHSFMDYYPPRLPWVGETRYRLFNRVVERAYELHDFLLGMLLEQIDANTTVLVVSDHGFYSDHLRPERIPVEAGGPAAQHRRHGVLVVWGPTIRKGTHLYGASVLDVCPTVLALLGLPVGRDMDGKVLLDIFESPPQVETISSWEEVEGRDGTLSRAEVQIDPVSYTEALEQLVELGYIQRPGDNRAEEVTNCLKELEYNEACSYMEAGLHARALYILKDLFEKFPDDYRIGIKLVECLLGLDRVAEARQVFTKILLYKESRAAAAKEKLSKLLSRPQDTLSSKLIREMKELHVETKVDQFTVEYTEGKILLKENRPELALQHFEKASEFNRNLPWVLLYMGECYLLLGDFERAERVFQEALSLDEDMAEAYLGLAKLYTKLSRFEEAADATLAALERRFFYPEAHYYLGVALHKCGKVDEALQALKCAIAQNPNYVEAYVEYAHICTELGEHVNATSMLRKAEEARERIQSVKRGAAVFVERELVMPAVVCNGATSEYIELPPIDENTVVIVSGLPRSGTSLMMQMLAAGGLDILTDGSRRADEYNPKGYFEYERVKELPFGDVGWIVKAKSKALKVVVPLVNFLPERCDIKYRVIFMLRDIDEVLASQRSMLEGTDRRTKIHSGNRLRRALVQQIEEAVAFLTSKKIPTLFVDYNSVVENPEREVERINLFLGRKLNTVCMIEQIDPTLRRYAKGHLGG